MHASIIIHFLLMNDFLFLLMILGINIISISNIEVIKSNLIIPVYTVVVVSEAIDNIIKLIASMNNNKIKNASMIWNILENIILVLVFKTKI